MTQADQARVSGDPRLETIERMESNVRSYSRMWPKLFRSASGSTITASDETEYLDFFAGAGTLNYGHNHPVLRDALIAYMQRDGILHSLDVSTEAKVAFLDCFERLILRPRDMAYRVQFPGPTGTNAVESAMKLARKVTGRQSIVAFTNGFHGMTLGSLAATGAAGARAGAGVSLAGVARMPYDGYLGPGIDTLDLLDRMLDDPSSGLDHPAAVLLETTQAEGGVNSASDAWLQRLERLCRQHEMLLIIDDIQVGCGRTGPFFSFEAAGIQPDLICLSKSLSGVGLPLAVLLISPEHDIWTPGEHNGTFRGNNAAFVTAAATIEHFWRTPDPDQHSVPTSVARKSQTIIDVLTDTADRWPDHVSDVRGRGMIVGLECVDPSQAKAIVTTSFAHGLIIELAGNRDQVVKVLPPLIIDDRSLERGLEIVSAAATTVFGFGANPRQS